MSGKVNLLAYQHGAHDRFYYRYKYDAENRLTGAYSSTTANIDPYGFRSTINEGDLRLDASYQYYLHGPLARMELSNTSKIVQGLDYVYTLQGWLKGVNGNKLSGGTADVGQDQASVAKDVLAYSLGYYSGDYLPVGGSSSSAFAMNYQPGGDAIGLNLYNGNISNSTYAIDSVQSGNTVGYTYQYDQLNRLKKLRQHNLSSASGTWDNNTVNTDHYSEAFDYDGNGNILALKRNAAGTTMDQLAYRYKRGSDDKLLNNKLSFLSDAIIGSAHTGELTDSTNYDYDAIGNLITDSKEGITGIDWTVYGKIGKINKTNAAENITYGYDPTGNRVSKTINGLSTWYVRDAQGNSLAVYDNKLGGTNWREQQLYGSSRLGMWKPNFNLASDSAGIKWNYTGLKFFELSNHLGNVMSVINDERTLTGGEYTPTVMNAQDYYAFGSVMPGREYTLTGSSAYRYGFNGKENDNEVKGTGNQQDYGMRIYDPRIGKFLSVDPLTKNFPWYASYQYAGNSPIQYIDLDGEEPKKKEPNYGKSVLIGQVNTTSLTDKFLKQFKTLNSNWLGKSGNIQEGLAYISSLQNDMASGTKLTNVVFNTHGGFIPNKLPFVTAFISDPEVKDSYIFGNDIQNFMKDPNSVNDAKRSAITSLKGVFDNMADGGDFVFSVCNLGKDDSFGKALQELSGGRINIYVTPDLVRISGNKDGKWIDIQELNLQRIQDGRWPEKKDQNYKEGFTLFPKGFGEAKKLNKNITLQSTGDKPVDLKTPVPNKK